jgi:hypothetical protein
MGLSDIASATIGRLASQLMRRVAGWTLVAVFGLAALYQGSVAAVVALEAEVGAFYAHLIIAGVYALLAIAAVVVLRVTVRRPFVDDDFRKSLATLPPEAQIATVIEALLLGYAMSRRKKKKN